MRRMHSAVVVVMSHKAFLCLSLIFISSFSVGLSFLWTIVTHHTSTTMSSAYERSEKISSVHVFARASQQRSLHATYVSVYQVRLRSQSCIELSFFKWPTYVSVSHFHATHTHGHFTIFGQLSSQFHRCSKYSATSHSNYRCFWAKHQATWPDFFENWNVWQYQTLL